MKEGLSWPEYDNYAYDDDDDENIDHVVDDGDENNDGDDDDDDPDQNEALLAMDYRRMYQSETSVYARLIHHQGHIIPRLLAPIVLSPSTPSEGGRQYQEHIEVRGILLECLSGVTMSQKLTQSAPPSGFQNMVDQALHITHVLGDNNVLNADVHAANFIVSDGRAERGRNVKRGKRMECDCDCASLVSTKDDGALNNDIWLGCVLPAS